VYRYHRHESESAREFKCSFDQAKIKFYRCFNAMYYGAKNATSELGCVHLLKTICLSALLYAVEVIPVTKSDISMLNHVTDRAVFRIFHCDDIKYVRSVDLPCVSFYISSRFYNFRRQFAERFSSSSIVLNCATWFFLFLSVFYCFSVFFFFSIVLYLYCVSLLHPECE